MQVVMILSISFIFTLTDFPSTLDIALYRHDHQHFKFYFRMLILIVE